MTNCPEKIPQNLQKTLDNVIKKEGYISYEVEKQKVAFDGGSLLSNQFLVNVRGKTEHGEKVSFIFVKGFISIPEVEGNLDLSQAFAAEAFMYNELYQVFEGLQDEAGVSTADRLKIVKSYGESGSEGIFLENIAAKGYKSCDRNYTMCLEVAEMALKEIAKFHALSFVLKAKRPEYYKKKIETIKHPMSFNAQWNETALHLASVAAKHVRGAAREKLDKFLPKVVPKWREYQLSQSTRTCLCHGDFRLNNLMMKYNGDRLEDLYVVDYQMLNIGCPLNDFFFFIFVGSDQQFRRQHLEYLKDFYYTSLSDFLKKFNLDSEDIYPKEEFDRDYKKRLDYGLLIVLYFMSFFLGGHEAAQEAPAAPAEERPPAGWRAVIAERLQGIVDDYVAWGYL